MHLGKVHTSILDNTGFFDATATAPISDITDWSIPGIGGTISDLFSDLNQNVQESLNLKNQELNEEGETKNKEPIPLTFIIVGAIVLILVIFNNKL